MADLTSTSAAPIISITSLLLRSAMMKVNELSPKYASGYLWRAKANTQIDSTSELGLAKAALRRNTSELAEADSANAAKYNSGLMKAYGYLAYYYILKKDNANALLYLRKKAALPLEPDDRRTSGRHPAVEQVSTNASRKPGSLHQAAGFFIVGFFSTTFLRLLRGETIAAGRFRGGCGRLPLHKAACGVPSCAPYENRSDVVADRLLYRDAHGIAKQIRDRSGTRSRGGWCRQFVEIVFRVRGAHQPLAFVFRELHVEAPFGHAGDIDAIERLSGLSCGNS